MQRLTFLQLYARFGNGKRPHMIRASCNYTFSQSCYLLQADFANLSSRMNWTCRNSLLQDHSPIAIRKIYIPGVPLFCSAFHCRGIITLWIIHVLDLLLPSRAPGLDLIGPSNKVYSVWAMPLASLSRLLNACEILPETILCLSKILQRYFVQSWCWSPSGVLHGHDLLSAPN